MPPGYVLVGSRTVRAPDGQAYDVLEAIQALPWTAQLCPLMRHEYTIWNKGLEWAWNVLSSMLSAQNPASFRAYFRGYQPANRYWDAPDGLRYWRGRFEIDRGQANDAGLRRVDEGGRRATSWAGPPYAPDGIGLYDQDAKGRWWPTQAALEAGYQSCRSCELTDRKAAIVATPRDPVGAAAFIVSAQQDSRAERGQPLSRDELAALLRQMPDRAPLSSDEDDSMLVVHAPSEADSADSERNQGGGDVSATVPKDRVVRKLLELRAREAPLEFSGYRGVLSQTAIAEIADVPVRDVTRAAIELDREWSAGNADDSEDDSIT